MMLSPRVEKGFIFLGGAKIDGPENHQQPTSQPVASSCTRDPPRPCLKNPWKSESKILSNDQNNTFKTFHEQICFKSVQGWECVKFQVAPNLHHELRFTHVFPCTKKPLKQSWFLQAKRPNRLFLPPAHHEVAKHPPRCGRGRVPELDLGFPVFQILASYHDRDWGWFTRIKTPPIRMMTWGWLVIFWDLGFIYQRKWCQMAPNCPKWWTRCVLFRCVHHPFSRLPSKDIWNSKNRLDTINLTVDAS